MTQQEIVEILKEELYTMPHDYLPEVSVIEGVEEAAARIYESVEKMKEALEKLRDSMNDGYSPVSIKIIEEALNAAKL